MAAVDPKLGLIVATDPTCVLKGRGWAGIPTLVWPEGIDVPVSDWLRTMIVEHGVATSSAREYAKVLRPFLRFCREKGRAFDAVDDDFLVRWREHLLRRADQVSRGRANASMKTVFSFYRWAEETGATRLQVGIYTPEDLPEGMSHMYFPISAKRVFSKGRHGRVYGTWTTPLTVADPERGSHVRHTPVEAEIRDLHGVAADRVHGERDSLILSWAEETGARRAEILRIGKSHLPDPGQLADLAERDEPWVISVQRKGGKRTPIHAPIDLLRRTLDYVEFERGKIVDRCRTAFVGYSEPDEVFLSGTTGRVLHPDSVTSIARAVFGKAGVGRSSLHRLRARFAVRTIETLVDAIFDGGMVGSESSWVETILVKASEMMGHSSPLSLRPYLTYVLNRRIQTADGTKRERLEARLRQLELLEGTLVRRLDHQQGLQEVARQLQAGRGKDASASLRRLADEIDGGTGGVVPRAGRRGGQAAT